MESYEATRAVFSRVQTIDLDHASKIMGYILLHHGEKDMIRFAYGPETLIISIVNRAKTNLGLSSNTSSAPLTNPPISNPIAISRPNPLSISLSSHNGFFNSSSPSSPSLWSPSYASVLNNNGGGEGRSFSSSSMDEYHPQDHTFTPFLTDPLSLPSKGVDFLDEYSSWDNNSNFNESNNINSNGHYVHRRSVSFNDMMYYGTDECTSGFGLKPCLYYARGFCKNGSACKFVHGVGVFGGEDNNCGAPSMVGVGSPCKFDAFEQCQEEFFRSKLVHQQQQQRLAAQLMSGAGAGVNLPYNKLNFLPTDAQRSAAAALMMGEEFHKLNRVRMARNNFCGMDSNPGSRQIYLTFPADSTFKEEDVSEYFNRFGPVQDVRIPYQQKRMFGFVTFVYPETVKIILEKGNPHFVLNSRVLVKPYKEKGKLPDKKHHQQMDRGEFSCSSPSGHDCREPFDFSLGGRMFYSTQEMLLRKKLEDQADLQQALELQERRLMNLQLMDLKNQQQQRNATVGSPIPSPSLSQSMSNHYGSPPSNEISQDDSEENKASPTEACDEQVAEGVNVAVSDSNDNVQKKDDSPNREGNELSGSLDHILPDNLFASPKKSASELRPSLFAPVLELDNGAAITSCSSPSVNSDSSIPATSPLSLASHKSCFFEMPRISTGHGALGM